MNKQFSKELMIAIIDQIKSIAIHVVEDSEILDLLELTKHKIRALIIILALPFVVSCGNDISIPDKIEGEVTVTVKDETGNGGDSSSGNGSAGGAYTNCAQHALRGKWQTYFRRDSAGKGFGFELDQSCNLKFTACGGQTFTLQDLTQDSAGTIKFDVTGQSNNKACFTPGVHTCEFGVSGVSVSLYCDDDNESNDYYNAL